LSNLEWRCISWHGASLQDPQLGVMETGWGLIQLPSERRETLLVPLVSLLISSSFYLSITHSFFFSSYFTLFIY
jgi:hypothetical protein